jgi:hypothetical protein
MKNRPIRKYARFYEDCWQMHIHLLRARTCKEAAKTFNTILDVDWKEKEGDYVGRCCMREDKPEIGIALINWKPDTKGIAVLVHECFHAVEFIMDYRDTKHKPHTSEAWAMLLDSLVSRCLVLLK